MADRDRSRTGRVAAAALRAAGDRPVEAARRLRRQAVEALAGARLALTEGAGDERARQRMDRARRLLTAAEAVERGRVDVTRWRVRLPTRRIVKGEAAGVFVIEVDPGDGFRPATVVEVDSALRQWELFGAADAAGKRSTVEQGERSTVGAAVGAVEHGAAVSPAPKRGAGGPGRVPPSRSTVEHGAASVPPSRPGSEPDRVARGGPRRKRAGWNLPPFGDDGRPVRAADRDAEIRRRREAGETVRSIAAALGCGVGTVARALRGPDGGAK